MSSEVATIPLRPADPAFIRRTSARSIPTAPKDAGQLGAKQTPLQRVFWVALVWLLAMAIRKGQTQSPESVIGAVIIILAAMLPSYLWVVGKVRGLPTFPACALTCTWTFGLPLVSEHPIVMLFPGWNQLVAAMSIAGFSLIGTLAWYLTARRPPRIPSMCWMMDEGDGSLTLLVTLGFCAVYTLAVAAGWLNLPVGLDSIARAITFAAEALSAFVLSYLLGRGRLAVGTKIVFLCFFGVLLIATLPSLLLILAMSLAAISAMAYTVASKRLPWRWGLLGILIFGFLHFGKSEMREKYWDEDDVRRPVPPWAFPGFLAEWASESVKVMGKANSEDDSSDLFERASLMHWLLYFQATTPNAIPYLAGESYAIIPRLFIPRILDPDKPRGNEGTVILSTHYGIQTREDTELTTLAFGLISEAYANFGYWGVAGLAVILGAAYGKVAHWARGMPILSFRALFAVLIASMSIQAELCASSYATLLFQSVVVLLAFSVAFMRFRPLEGTLVSRLD